MANKEISKVIVRDKSYVFYMEDGRVFWKVKPLDPTYKGFCHYACKFWPIGKGFCDFKGICNYQITEETRLLLEL